MHVWLGLGETAIEHFARAMRLSPQDPQFMMMQAGTAFGHFLAGRAREAADWAEAAVLANPNVWLTRCALAASRAAGGDLDGAKAAMAEVLRMDPTFRVSNLFSVFPIRDETNRAVWVDALKRAGLPD